MTITNLQFNEMFERVVKKIENSPALNGGFDKLVISVEHIKEKQEEICDKIDDVDSRLYEPDKGFFARVIQIEHNTQVIKDNILSHLIQDEEFQKEIKKTVTETIPDSSKHIIKKLESIGGRDLVELQAIIDFRKSFKRFFWLIMTGIGTTIGTIAFDILKHHV